MSIWLFLIILINLGISWWNAYVCGKSWDESKAVGGWVRFMIWCVAIMSAIGFSSVLILPLIFITHALVPDYFTQVHMQGAMNLWYVMIIFPLLGTGLAITVESWRVAWRERDLLSIGTASWNTFAQIHNTVGAINSLGPAFSQLGDVFGNMLNSDSDDAKGKAAIIGVMLMILVVSLALIGGALITMAIIQKYRGTVPLPVREARTA